MIAKASAEGQFNGYLCCGLQAITISRSVPQGRPERPGWQVRISRRFPGRMAGWRRIASRPETGGAGWPVGEDAWYVPEPRAATPRFSFAAPEPIRATGVALQGWLPGDQGIWRCGSWTTTRR